MKIDLLGGSYKDKYVQLNSQRTINWYINSSFSEQTEAADTTTGASREQGKERRSLRPLPALTLFASIAGTCGRGAFAINGRGFVVIDNLFYEVYNDSTTTLRGTLSASPTGSTRKVWMGANNENQIMLADNTAGYIFNTSTNVFTQITDADFPGAETLTDQDGYFIVAKDGRVYWSDVLAGLSWTGVNTYTPSYKADKVKAVVSLQESLYNFGESTLEVYFNNGTTFARMNRTSMQYGVVGVATIQVIANTILFVSRYDNGQPQVVQISPNNELTTISEPSIAYQLGKIKNLEDMYAWSFSSPDGHIFYVLTVPGADRTFVYDLTNKEWFEWQTFNGIQYDGTHIYGKCFANHQMFLGGSHFVTSNKDGNIYKLDFDAFTDNGNTIIRQRDTQIYHQEYKSITVHELEIDMNSGSGLLSGQGSEPRLMLQISKNGGKTFGQERMVRLSKHGDYDYRCKVRMLGAARNWVIRLKLSDPIDMSIIGARVRGSVGAY